MKLTEYWRYFRKIVFGTLFVICGYQCYGSILEFIDHSTATQAIIEKSAVVFPMGLTVCLPSLRKFQSLTPANTTPDRLEQLIKANLRVELIESFNKTKDIATLAWGYPEGGRFIPCVTLLLEEDLLIGFHHRIVIQILKSASAQQVTFYIHDKGAMIPSTAEIIGMYLRTLTLNQKTSGNLFTYRVSRQKWSLNPNHNDCTDEKNYSTHLWECIQNALETRLECVPPWSHHPSTNETKCLGDAYLDQSSIFFHQLVVLTNMDDITNMTGCKMACSFFRYSAVQYDIEERDSSQLTTYHFFIDSGSYDHTKEVEAFTLLKLVADIGGFMGLMLGISIWTTFERFQRTLVRFLGNTF